MKKILISITFLAAFLSTSTSAAQTLNGQMAGLIMIHDMHLFPDSLPTKVDVSLLSSNTKSDVFKMALYYPVVGVINLLLKGPQGFLSSTKKNLHGMMIVSGFFTGEQSVHLIGHFPDKVVIGFEYPYGVADFQKDPGTVLQFVRKTPGQIALALHWLTQQSWMKSNGLSVMGVSLGGVFLPSGLHLSQSMGVVLEKSIFVGTGTEISSILRENLKLHVNEPFLSPLVKSLSAPTVLMDPRLHLPYLRGPSLVIQTEQDTVIPLSSKSSLINSLSGEKTEVVLQGPHINSDQKELIEKIQQIVLQHLN